MKVNLKKSRNFKKISAAIITIALVIFLLNYYQSPIRNLFYLISFPVQKTLWQAGQGVSNFFETIGEIHPVKSLQSKFNGVKNLRKENAELKLKLKEILAENAGLLELKKENEILRQALEIGLEKEFKLVLAQVSGKDISEDSLIINKGSKDGVKNNQPVITEQKFLIGKISESYKDFSKVMLISNKASSFDGKIANSGVFGIIKGKGNSKILFDLIPKEKEIKKGDLVVTAALGGVFPEGLLVGEISEIKKSDIEPWQVAQIQPAFNIGEAEKIFIIIER